MYIFSRRGPGDHDDDGGVCAGGRTEERRSLAEGDRSVFIEGGPGRLGYYYYERAEIFPSEFIDLRSECFAFSRARRICLS